MSRVPLKARTGFRYGRRMLRSGDRFEARPNDAEILIGLGRAVPVATPIQSGNLVAAALINTNIEDARVTYNLDATIIPPAQMVIDPPPVDEPLTILLVETPDTRDEDEP